MVELSDMGGVGSLGMQVKSRGGVFIIIWSFGFRVKSYLHG